MQIYFFAEGIRMDQFSRSALLIGRESVEKLGRAKVALFGVGGVGGYVAEALARSGVGTIDLYDPDTVSLTNLNRQIVALHSTLGQPKAEVIARRLRDINPAVAVTAHPLFYLPENAEQVDVSSYDYIADAIDTVTAKLHLIERCYRLGVPIISAMGAGNKLDPTAFRVADLYKTRMDPLARVMRRELKKRGVKSLKVVYSEEPPIRPLEDLSISCRAHCICPPGTKRHCTDRRDIPGSVAFVPSVAGLIIAGEVVKDLCGHSPEQR